VSPMPRRLLRAACVPLAVAAGFGAGVVTGVVGTGGSEAEAPSAGVIDEAAARISAGASRSVDREELERAAVEGMLRALGDRWSAYYDPAEFAAFSESVEGRYSGVGVWLRPDPRGVVVGSVQPGSPAARAGVLAGERVRRIAGSPVRSVDDAVRLLREESTRGPVELRMTGGRGDRAVRLVRESIQTSDVEVEPLPGWMVRIAVAGFSRGVGRDVREALNEHAAASGRGVVLDLRGNPGGLLTEAVEVASAFLRDGPVVRYERRAAPPRTFEALGDGDTRTPVVVLVDGRTASAAEVVAAALQDRNRAVVVGAPTFGKGSVQEPTRLSDGSAIELTVGRYLTPAGRDIDGVGVTPDVLVSDAQPPAVALDRARDVLVGLLAALPTSGRG